MADVPGDDSGISRVCSEESQWENGDSVRKKVSCGWKSREQRKKMARKYGFHLRDCDRRAFGRRCPGGCA